MECAGEVNFVVIGVILQTMSMITESTRLVLVQILLQVKPFSRLMIAQYVIVEKEI